MSEIDWTLPDGLENAAVAITGILDQLMERLGVPLEGAEEPLTPSAFPRFHRENPKQAMLLLGLVSLTTRALAGMADCSTLAAMLEESESPRLMAILAAAVRRKYAATLDELEAVQAVLGLPQRKRSRMRAAAQDARYQARRILDHPGAYFGNEEYEETLRLRRLFGEGGDAGAPVPR